MSHDPKLLEFALGAVDRLPRDGLVSLFAATATALNAQGGTSAIRDALQALRQSDATVGTDVVAELFDALFGIEAEGGGGVSVNPHNPHNHPEARYPTDPVVTVTGAEALDDRAIEQAREMLVLFNLKLESSITLAEFPAFIERITSERLGAPIEFTMEMHPATGPERGHAIFRAFGLDVVARENPRQPGSARSTLWIRRADEKPFWDSLFVRARMALADEESRRRAELL